MFLQCPDGLSAKFHPNFLAINDNCSVLKVWLPDLFCMALRKTDIAAVLLAFTGKFAYLHNFTSFKIQGVIISVLSLPVNPLLALRIASLQPSKAHSVPMYLATRPNFFFQPGLRSLSCTSGSLLNFFLQHIFLQSLDASAE